MSTDLAPVVRLENIVKIYGKVRASDNVCLDIRAGRIKTLLGENGAGKSTLMGVLSGLTVPDSGRILVDGRPVRLTSPGDGLKVGIGMVYQHFKLVEAMTVAENVVLGQEGGFWLNTRRMDAKVAELAEGFGLKLDPKARVGDLSMGERQLVEILKLLYRESRVLIFDEPTAVLTPHETDILFKAMLRMSSAGKSLVFISHKLEEVMSISDEIAILRKGRIEAEFSREVMTTKEDLARRMIGRDIVLETVRPSMAIGDTVLTIDKLTGCGLNDITLDVRKGEVLAVVGVVGNGQHTLVEAVTGMLPAKSFTGEIRISGVESELFHRKAGWRDGICYIPEDRRQTGTCLDMDMVDNFLITTRAGFVDGLFLDRRGAAESAHFGMLSFGVTPPIVHMTAGQFSGGNLQKFVLARELSREPRLIVAEQPTQGLDVAATEDVWRTLLKARKNSGILLITSDLAEAFNLADRVAVMFRGWIMDVFPATDKHRMQNIGLLMAGVPLEDE